MKSLVLVDDSTTLQMSLMRSLEISDVKVGAASDRQHARNQIKAGLMPALITMDINRQLGGQVETALVNLSHHRAALCTLEGGKALSHLHQLEERMARWTTSDVTQVQRPAHAQATPLELAEIEAPKIELF